MDSDVVNICGQAVPAGDIARITRHLANKKADATAAPRVCVHLRDGSTIEVPCKSNIRAKSTYNYLVEDWGKARAVARSIGGGDAK